MSQLTLIEKPQEVKAKPKPKKPKVSSNVVIEENPEIKKDHTYAYMNLRHASKTTLEKRIEVILYDYGYSIKPYPQASTCYGGYWCSGGRFDKKDLGQLFPYLIKWKRDFFTKPYTDNLTDAHRFSNLRPEHIYINVSHKTKRWIDRNTETSWDDFLREWNTIEVMPTPEGYLDLVSREEELKREFDEIKEIVRGIQREIRKTNLDSPEDVRKIVGRLRELEELIPMKSKLESQLEIVKEDIEGLLRRAV